jgi:hypothetical protein
MPYHDLCSAHNNGLNATLDHFNDHDISVLLRYLYLPIIFLLLFIILQDNRFARNLFKRSKTIQKLLSHLAEPWLSQVTEPESSQVATGSFS